MFNVRLEMIYRFADQDPDPYLGKVVQQLRIESLSARCNNTDLCKRVDLGLVIGTKQSKAFKLASIPRSIYQEVRGQPQGSPRKQGKHLNGMETEGNKHQRDEY